MCNKDDKFPMTVVAIFSYLGAPDDEGAVYLDFERNEGDVLSEIVENLELCEQRYKLPVWKQDEECGTLYVKIENPLCEFEYWIDDIGGIKLYLHRDVGAANPKILGDSYPNIEAAKEAAERHFNELITSMIRCIKQLEGGVL